MPDLQKSNPICFFEKFELLGWPGSSQNLRKRQKGRRKVFGARRGLEPQGPLGLMLCQEMCSEDIFIVSWLHGWLKCELVLHEAEIWHGFFCGLKGTNRVTFQRWLNGSAQHTWEQKQCQNANGIMEMDLISTALCFGGWKITEVTFQSWINCVRTPDRSFLPL